MVVVDVPLLFERRYEDMFEGTLLVYAPRDVQLQRLMERDTLNAEAAQRRLGAQLSIDEKRGRATWIIDNHGDPADTERQVAAWWDEVLGTDPAASAAGTG